MSAKIRLDRGSKPGLAARRRQRRRRAVIAVGFLLALALTGCVYLLNRPFLRITDIRVDGADSSLAEVARPQITGSYLGLVPRDSIVFYPASNIRRAILAADTDIAAVSVYRSGLQSITLKTIDRVPIARWCGDHYVARTASSTPTADCFIFDDNGRIFATSTELTLVNPFNLYEPLPPGTTALGAILPHQESFPGVFAFGRALTTRGTTVTAINIRDQEADLYLESGTRLTYVLGQEQDALTALVSAGSNINLTDSSIEYVDLRFGSKVYVKRKVDNAEKTVKSQ